MDYGQPNQNGLNQPFSAEGLSGAGLENAKWGGAEADPTRDQSMNVGRNAMGEQPVEDEEPVVANAMGDFGPTPEPLGQIIETEPAPAPMEEVSFDKSVIKVDGDTLDKRAVAVFENMEKDLHKTGDAAGFVNEFEEAKIVNLYNSWDRTFGDAA